MNRAAVFVPHRSGSMLAKRVLSDMRRLSATAIEGPLRIASEPQPEATVVISLRDPRDVLVSMFFAYCYSHEGPLAPNTGRRAAVADRGIDDFVIRMATADRPPYEGGYGTGIPRWNEAGNVRERHEQFLDLAERREATLLSYEEMVGEFGCWLAALGAAVGVKDADALLRIERSHGNFTAMGRDSHRRHVRPGDYAAQLAPETITVLDEVFGPYTDRLETLRSGTP